MDSVCEVKMLKRSDLINIKNEFEYKIERDNLDINIIKDGLEKIISKLNYSDCESDSRFVPYGGGGCYSGNHCLWYGNR